MAQNPEEELPLRERPIAEVAQTLERVLGQRLVAIAVSERDPKRIGAFARSEELPSEETEITIRDLAEITEVMLNVVGGSEETVRAKMIGSHPNLDDRAIIEVFHEGEYQGLLANAEQL